MYSVLASKWPPNAGIEEDLTFYLMLPSSLKNAPSDYNTEQISIQNLSIFSLHFLYCCTWTTSSLAIAGLPLIRPSSIPYHLCLSTAIMPNVHSRAAMVTWLIKRAIQRTLIDNYFKLITILMLKYQTTSLRFRNLQQPMRACWLGVTNMLCICSH